MEITNLLNWNVKMDHCAKIRVELGFRNYGQFCGSGLIGIQEFFYNYGSEGLFKK